MIVLEEEKVGVKRKLNIALSENQHDQDNCSVLNFLHLSLQFQPLNASSNPQDNSNLSAGSNAGDDEVREPN